MADGAPHPLRIYWLCVSYLVHIFNCICDICVLSNCLITDFMYVCMYLWLEVIIKTIRDWDVLLLACFHEKCYRPVHHCVMETTVPSIVFVYSGPLPWTFYVLCKGLTATKPWLVLYLAIPVCVIWHLGLPV